MRHMLLAALVAGLLIPAAQAQAPYAGFDDVDAPATRAADEAADAAWAGYLQRSAGALAASGQPRELAFAATLRSLTLQGDAAPAAGDAPSTAVPPDPQVEAWREAAAQKAGDDVLANVLLVQGNDAASTRRRVRAAQRWLAADPQNLAPLLFRGGGIDALLADARSAQRFDLQMLPQVRWMQSALLRQSPTAAERAAFAGDGDYDAAEHAAISATAIWSAVAIPALQTLVEGCAPEATRANPARLRECRHVARLMADASDTQLGRMIGVALLERTAASAAERADAQARRRTQDWQMLEWGRASAQLPRDGAAQYARLLADPSIRSELDLVERALQEAGVPSTPPAGWQPPRD
ncbi:hypothetical protein LDO26_07295 [Luteimonas sp. BDR2-5]|uniref:hypothetical protein n=1 Tax=Proluteimonas luteida TaxID=2878685 RepID=UPI001E35ED76|nr:hypothetical protein [Luteimonas sp. BDR2-5]MCD9028011.1 hypothetical protein [Luteimonas sp. BDR2-5]